jgi:hypothetical protein
MPHGRQASLFNLLAVVFLGLSALSLGWVVDVALDPYGRLNPFPPPALYPTSVSAATSATMTPSVEPTATQSTPTPALTETPTETSVPPTPAATATAEATAQLTATPTFSPTLLPTVTPAPSPTRSALTYTASITYLVHPVEVCDWMGVGGTVTDLSGKAALGSYVHIWGLDNIDQVVAVGGNTNYGPSGWELRLARGQIVGNWSVQLVASPETKLPLSAAYTISMPGDCKRNLALVRFQQNH